MSAIVAAENLPEWRISKGIRAKHGRAFSVKLDTHIDADDLNVTNNLQ